MHGRAGSNPHKEYDSKEKPLSVFTGKNSIPPFSDAVTKNLGREKINFYTIILNFLSFFAIYLLNGAEIKLGKGQKRRKNQSLFALGKLTVSPEFEEKRNGPLFAKVDMEKKNRV